MGLQPLPQPLIVAHQLRRMAADLVLQAEALEASVPPHQVDISPHNESFFGDLKFRPDRIDKVRPQRGGQ